MTLDQQKKWGKHLANGCFFCGENEVTIEHILISLFKGFECMVFSFCSFSITWVLPCLVRESAWLERFLCEEKT